MNKKNIMMPTMPPDAHKISLKIIEAIREHPVLYISDVKGSAIKLQEFRQKVWKRISDELGLDSSWVRLRWKNLRDTYCRILKYKNNPDRGTRRKKWVFEDHLNFLKFPYEADYMPQCVELSDEYINEINSTGANSDNLLDQLDDRNDEDYSEYLEVLEETTADPILPNESHDVGSIESDMYERTNDNDVRKEIGMAFKRNIQSQFIKIRPKRMKLEQDHNSTEEANDASPNNSIVNSIDFSSVVGGNHAGKSSEIGDSAYLTPIVPKTSIQLFFNSMAQTVKSLPPKAQAEIKMSVCKIVTEAEVKHSKRKIPISSHQFIAPPGMIPKLVLIPCSMVDETAQK